MYASQTKFEKVYQPSKNRIHSLRNHSSLGLYSECYMLWMLRKYEWIKVKSRQDWLEFLSKESSQKLD